MSFTPENSEDRRISSITRSENGRCSICSSRHNTVRHRHYSSKWLREMLGTETSDIRSYCPSCKSGHLPYPYERVKLIVSDDTLHMFFAPPGHIAENQYNGDLVHVDYLKIQGADIETLTEAFNIEYNSRVNTRPLDVVLIAGYNDIDKGYSRGEIMQRFREFSDAVIAAAPENASNTVTISDLMYPPKFTWFFDDGPIPRNHRGNLLTKMEWLNEAILSLNLDNWVTEFHRLRKYGIRVCTRRHVDQFGQETHQRIRQHRFEQWQGEDPAMKLLLVNEQRFRLGAAVNKFFALRTQM